jgi:tRNA (cmo5U34)-methyltransferase
LTQFHFDPGTYLDEIRADIPVFDELQEETARATEGVAAKVILDLGVGTGETARRVLAVHPRARLVGIDESEQMLAAAGLDADLRVSRLEDPLPPGPFDLVFSALAIHHLDGPGKADLFRRVAAVLAPGGRFVLGDVVVPDDPAHATTPLNPGFDVPARVDDQLGWLRSARFDARVVWSERDLAVLVSDLSS